MTHAVNVCGGKVKALTNRTGASRWRSAYAEAFLAHSSADHSDSSSRDIVIVKARVLVIHPADQPGSQMLVAEQLLIDPLRTVVLDVLDPQFRTVGQLSDEVLELGRREVATTRPR